MQASTYLNLSRDRHRPRYAIDGEMRLLGAIMKNAFSRAMFAVLFALLSQSAAGESNRHARSAAAYRADNTLHPATLMSQHKFKDTARRGYVVVEGYIDYVAGGIPKSGNTTRIKTEADGDFHFEMQSTNAARPPGESPAGLVCEIDPAWQLSNWNLLSQISRKKPITYRKVRVYGWLRFGTEAGHSGTKDYQIGNGRVFRGHWEIHPVEKVEAIDGRGAFQIGPSAHVKSWPVGNRYKVTNANFAAPGPSNYAKLIGSVQAIVKSPDKSGDVDVSLKVGSRTYLATIPQYYVASFDARTQALTLAQLPNFAAISYSLRPSHAERAFYGLRNWKFVQTGASPALQPVEMIK
jgi:hypothetical protein